MSTSTSYRHILKYTGIFGGIQVVTILASIIRNKALAVLIGKYGQGVSELFNNTINLISSATTLVIPVSVVRRVSLLYERHGDQSDELRDEIRVIRSWSVLTGLLGSLLVIAVCPVLSRITFGSYDFTNSYLYLSPMLLLLSVNGTEVAILKGTRRLRQLTTASVITSIGTMAVCVASYYFWRIRGIVIALDACVLLTALVSLRYTTRVFPYKASPFRGRVLRRGGPLIKLSVAFLVASVFASLAEMLIRAYISNTGSIGNVGLYGAGFALTVTYTRFIFTAMDADFYPRLSGMSDDAAQMNIAINRQAVVCVLIMVPCLMAFCAVLPQVINLLYTAEYQGVNHMVLCATLYMFSKAIITPVAYTSLAKGDSRMYLTMETISAVAMAVCVIGGYKLMGLTGCGVGLTASNLVELVIILPLYRSRYGIRLTGGTVALALAEMLILVAGLAAIVLVREAVTRYALVGLLIIVSAAISFFTLRKHKTT